LAVDALPVTPTIPASSVTVFAVNQPLPTGAVVISQSYTVELDITAIGTGTDSAGGSETTYSIYQYVSGANFSVTEFVSIDDSITTLTFSTGGYIEEANGEYMIKKSSVLRSHLDIQLPLLNPREENGNRTSCL
jgi:hypothetical protein